MDGSALVAGPSSLSAHKGNELRQISVSATFASTHRDEAHGPHIHGHTFHVRATEMGNDAGVRYDLLPDLEAVLSELNYHSLDDMLIGGSQTLDGISSWVMERLLTRHPRLVRVEVHTADQPDVVVASLREIR